MRFNKNNFPFKFVAFSQLIFLIIFILEKINKRFWLNDFKVYYEASKAFFNDTQVYNTLFTLGSGYYKYSPFTLLPFYPLHIFSYETASVIHFFTMALFITVLFILLRYILIKYKFQNNDSKQNSILSLGLLCVISHLFRELHLGNINAAVLFLLCLSLLFICQSQFILAGMLLGFSVITKPFFILLFLPLFLRKKVGVVLIALVSILICLFVPSLFVGIAKNNEMLKEWGHIMSIHNESFPSSNTIDSLLAFYFHIGLPSWFQLLLLSLLCVLYAALFWVNKSLEKKQKDSSAAEKAGFILEWFLLIALIPNIFKTDTQHFLFSIPVILIIINQLSILKSYKHNIIFIALIFFFSENFLAGKTFVDWSNQAGILGITNMLIISFALSLWFFNKTKNSITA